MSCCGDGTNEVLGCSSVLHFYSSYWCYLSTLFRFGLTCRCHPRDCRHICGCTALAWPTGGNGTVMEKCLQFVIVLPALWLLLCGTTTESFDHNVLLHGDLGENTGDTPSHSSTDTLGPSASSTSFLWIRHSGVAGELRIANIKRDTVRWTRTVVLGPSWYRLSVETRTEVLDPV